MWGTNSVAGKHMDKTLDLMMLNHPPSGTVILVMWIAIEI